ncbi:MAG: hypothetical protein H7256_15050 [Bdellovibrio sp.]|nr:hypothetical protein [Bdellovibrio sp.]
MSHTKIKNSLMFLVLTIVTVIGAGCASSQNQVAQRMVSSSVAMSEQNVEVIDLAASLKAGDTSKKEEDQIKYRKIQLDGFEKIDQLKEWLTEIQTKQEGLSATYGLKKDYFKSIKVALQFIDELEASHKSITDIRSEPRFFDLVNLLNALRNRSYSSKEESLEILTAPISLLSHLQRPEVVLPTSASQLPIQQEYSLSPEAYSKELVRSPLFSPNAQVCTYAGPKTGYGFKAGLKILCGDQKLKLKFGPESHTGPFNSRLFRAAGILTPRIDFVSQVEMKYDRKFITEFNSRKQTNTKVTVLGIKVKEKAWNTAIKDPMGVVSAMKLNDGTVLAGAQLAEFKKGLYTSTDKNFTFDESKESKIATVTFTEGSVIEDIDAIEVGPWRFDEPNHMNNEVLRQQFMMSIWVGNNDLPMNNTRLLITKERAEDKTKTVKVIPIYIDVGVGLGVSDSIKGMSSYEIDKMSGTMSETYTDSRGDDPTTQKTKVVFQFINKTPTKIIEKLTFADVVNGLNLMCLYKPEQLNAALLQAGIPTSLAEKATSKLVSRRSKLIKDLELQRQFSHCLHGPS